MSQTFYPFSHLPQTIQQRIFHLAAESDKTATTLVPVSTPSGPSYTSVTEHSLLFIPKYIQEILTAHQFDEIGSPNLYAAWVKVNGWYFNSVQYWTPRSQACVDMRRSLMGVNKMARWTALEDWKWDVEGIVIHQEGTGRLGHMNYDNHQMRRELVIDLERMIGRLGGRIAMHDPWAIMPVVTGSVVEIQDGNEDGGRGADGDMYGTLVTTNSDNSVDSLAAEFDSSLSLDTGNTPSTPVRSPEVEESPMA